MNSYAAIALERSVRRGADSRLDVDEDWMTRRKSLRDRSLRDDAVFRTRGVVRGEGSDCFTDGDDVDPADGSSLPRITVAVGTSSAPCLALRIELRTRFCISSAVISRRTPDSVRTANVALV
jgi:hypothetical protein